MGGGGRETYVGSDHLPAALRQADMEDLYQRRTRAPHRGRGTRHRRTGWRSWAGTISAHGNRVTQHSGEVHESPELHRQCFISHETLEKLPAPAQIGKTKVG